MSAPTTPQKSRLAIMPPPPVPLTPKSITKTSIQPRPKSYVRGEVTVRKIERVKSERPSPPPTPVRVKSEPVERAPITPVRSRSLIPFTPPSSKSTPSPRSFNRSTSVIRRRSSATPAVRSRSFFKTPTPSPSRHRSISRSVPSSSSKTPIQIDESDDEYSPPSSPTPSSRSLPQRRGSIDSTRSESIFRGGSIAASVASPFIMPRQKPVRRPRDREEGGGGGGGGGSVTPLPAQPPAMIMPQDMANALGDAGMLINDLTKAQLDVEGDPHDTAKVLLDALFGQVGDARRKFAAEVAEATFPDVDADIVAELVTLLHDAVKRAVMAHLRKYRDDSAPKRASETALKGEWYRGWKVYLQHAGEDVKRNLDRQEGERIFRSFDEVLASRTKDQYERIKATLPIDRDMLRQWRELVKRLGAEVMLEVRKK